MKILLTNFRLSERAGSELCTIEMAEALKAAAGQEVAIFTFDTVHLPRKFDIPVFTPRDGALIERFAPQVIEVHHAPCLYYLGRLNLSSVVIFSSLGVVPPERGPVVWPGVVAAIACSEEAQAGVRTSPFGKAVPCSISRNWFDDRGLPRPPIVARPNRNRWLVVSNHLSAPMLEKLKAVKVRRSTFSFTHVGLPSNSVPITPQLLNSVDGVITIGRTALLAGAIGKPCLIYDFHGCDGFLSPELFQGQARVNFSGRMTRHEPSVEELADLLFAQAVDVAGTADILWRNHRLTARRNESLVRFQQAIQRGRGLSAIGRSEYAKQSLDLVT